MSQQSPPPPRMPLLFPHPQLLPQPFPLPQQNRSSRIQMQLPPNPLFEPLQLPAQPQFVAVKSLIVFPPGIIYGLLYAAWPVNVSGPYEKIEK